MSIAPPARLSVAAAAAAQSPADWALSRDGSRVAFSLDQAGDRPLYVMETGGGWPVRVTAAPGRYGRPTWSPDGRRLATVAGRSLITLAADGTERRSLFETDAALSGPAWSPDGERIAFLCRARGWDQVWSVPAAGGTASRLTAGAADCSDLQWSPDSSRIAYTSTGNGLHGRDVFLLDASGGGETCVTAGWGCISLAPCWRRDGELAFLSERDGFLHVYLRAASGTIRQLTAGACEDGTIAAHSPQHLCWSPDGTVLAFLRNRRGCSDIMLLDPAGTVRRLSARDGNWGIVGWQSPATILASCDDPVSPPDLYRLPVGGDAAEQITISSGGMDRAGLRLPERVGFAAEDGTQLSGLLYRAWEGNGAGRPAIVVAHGGPSSQFTFAWRPLYQLLAQAGFSLLCVDYRGSTGYGRAFREANYGGWGAADVDDCLAGARFLGGQAADPERIGMYGASYGGYLVYCALTRAPALLRCAVALSADSELALSYRLGDRTGRQDMERHMGSPEQFPERYRERSPVYSAERIEAPLLIMHGRDDRRVVLQMSRLMVAALAREGKLVEHKFYEGEGHTFRRYETKRDSIERTLTFFERYLR